MTCRLLNREMGGHVRIIFVDLHIFVIIFRDGIDTLIRSSRSRATQVRRTAAQGSAVLTSHVMVVRVSTASASTIARIGEALSFTQSLNLI
jgi:hypothetical protein